MALDLFILADCGTADRVAANLTLLKWPGIVKFSLQVCLDKPSRLERKHVKFWQLGLCVSGHETQVSKTSASTFYVSSMNVDSKWRLYISGKC